MVIESAFALSSPAIHSKVWSGVYDNTLGKTSFHRFGMIKPCKPGSLRLNYRSQLSKMHMTKTEKIATGFSNFLDRRTFHRFFLAAFAMFSTSRTWADNLPGAGETVLLVGASGAIGQFVTQALKARGCKVFRQE